MGGRMTPLTRRRLLERGAVGASLVVAAPLLQACGGDSASGTSTAAATGAAGKTIDTVVIAAPSTPPSLNTDLANGTQGFEAQHNVYDSLMTFQVAPPRDGVAAWDISSLDNVRPQLAEAATQSDDGLATQFRLRRGVLSTEGNELTTADVEFFFNVLVANSRGLRGLVAQLGNIDPARDVEIVDRYTFTVSHRAPSPLFLAALSLVLASVPDATAAKPHTSVSDPTASRFLATNAVGFGPYRLDSLRQGQRAEFSARDDYWGGVQSPGRVVMQAVPRSNNRLALLKSGNAQIATGLTPIQLQQAGKTADNPGNRQLYVAFQCRAPPFDDVEVRRAFQYATDYDAILGSVFKDTAQRLYGSLPSTYPDEIGKELNRYEFDPERASSMLSSAGHDKLTVEMIYNSEVAQTEETALQLQAAWRRSGIDAKLTALTSLQWATSFVQGTYRHLAMFLDQANVPDMAYVSNLLYTNQSVANGGHYANAEVDRLTRASISTADAARRTDIAHELQRILIEDPPCLWLAQPGIHYGIADPVSVVGWETDNGIVYSEIA